MSIYLFVILGVFRAKCSDKYALLNKVLAFPLPLFVSNIKWLVLRGILGGINIITAFVSVTVRGVHALPCMYIYLLWVSPFAV